MQQEELSELKSQWLDAEVSVAPKVSRLRRFAGRRGIVRSVNWNGDCLVEWQGIQDDGWYDLAPADLVVIAPEPSAEED